MVVTADAVEAFLGAPTPEAWIVEAGRRLPDVLLDHANCELKAASTALGFLYRYPERTRLARSMSRLAREELRHYEQVRSHLDAMNIPFEKLTASRYAGGLRESVRDPEPLQLLDRLLVGALIEARSCERFAALAPHLPAALGRFYRGLLASEARHFEQYLGLAKSESGVPDADIEARLAELRKTESALITEPDVQFRFHSGPPAETFASLRGA